MSADDDDGKMKLLYFILDSYEYRYPVFSNIMKYLDNETVLTILVEAILSRSRSTLILLTKYLENALNIKLLKCKTSCMEKQLESVFSVMLLNDRVDETLRSDLVGLFTYLSNCKDFRKIEYSAGSLDNNYCNNTNGNIDNHHTINNVNSCYNTPVDLFDIINCVRNYIRINDEI